MPTLAAGRTRSEALAERLASANVGALTTVEALQGPLIPARDIHASCGFDVVVSTGDDMDAQCALDEACRAVGVAFIFAHAPGLFAFTFVDLGDEYLVDDTRTVAAPPAMLESVTRDAPVAAATVCDAASHGGGLYKLV